MLACILFCKWRVNLDFLLVYHINCRQYLQMGYADYNRRCSLMHSQLHLITSNSCPAGQDLTAVRQSVNAFDCALQVKIFGSYVRWAVDLPPPDDAMPARVVLSTIDTAVRHAKGNLAGPVHLNCQFREPLTPATVDWSRTCLQV